MARQQRWSPAGLPYVRDLMIRSSAEAGHDDAMSKPPERDHEDDPDELLNQFQDCLEAHYQTTKDADRILYTAWAMHCAETLFKHLAAGGSTPNWSETWAPEPGPTTTADGSL